MKKYFLFFLLGNFSCSSTSVNKNITIEDYSQVRLLPNKSRSQYESFGKNYMVSSQGIHSTDAAVKILNQGGNLFDAFTALSFTISVERPHSTGLGGGGFVLFYHAKDKKVYSLDFREMASHKAHSKMFLDENGKALPERSRTGALAIATPGHVAGVLEIQKKYGKLSLTKVMAPAIKLAAEGFKIYPALHNALLLNENRLSQFDSSKKIFLSSDGKALDLGKILIQKDLAQTLLLISKKGPKVFYQGEVGQKISTTVSNYKGLVDAKDLANYKTKWRDPVQSTYHDFQIYSQPPPSSGGVHVLEILNILESDQLHKMGPQGSHSIHLTASAMQKAFIDRAQFMGDPDFIKIPVDELISKKYAAKARAKINPKKAQSVLELKNREESPETTHFSLMDKEGNAIVSTQTINGYFGSALVAEGTGIVLNNEMDDFAASIGDQNLFGAIGGKNNLIEPLKRPLSSMSPTLVMKNGLPVLALGTPSGTRIITCVAQTILNILEYQLPLWQAVTLTRYHQQWQPDELQIESPLFPETTLEALKVKGWKIKEKDAGCRIQAIQKEKNILHGVSDPREEGASVGL